MKSCSQPHRRKQYDTVADAQALTIRKPYEVDVLESGQVGGSSSDAGTSSEEDDEDGDDEDEAEDHNEASDKDTQDEDATKQGSVSAPSGAARSAAPDSEVKSVKALSTQHDSERKYERDDHHKSRLTDDQVHSLLIGIDICYVCKGATDHDAPLCDNSKKRNDCFIGFHPRCYSSHWKETNHQKCVCRFCYVCKKTVSNKMCVETCVCTANSKYI